MPVSAQVTDSANVTVLADDSLSVPLTELARLYSQQRKTTINLTFGDSAGHIEQILSGAAGDLFISAYPAHFVKLRAEGVMDIYSQRPVTRNRLVFLNGTGIVAPVTLNQPAVLMQALLEKITSLRVIVLDGRDAGGLATREAFRRMGLNEILTPHIQIAREKAQLFSLVRSGDAVGFAAYTDALRHNLLYQPLPLEGLPETHPPIRYEGVVIGGENMAASRKFLDFLTTGIAREVFQKYGFIQ